MPAVHQNKVGLETICLILQSWLRKGLFKRHLNESAKRVHSERGIFFFMSMSLAFFSTLEVVMQYVDGT